MFRKKPPQPTQIDWLIVGLGNPGPEYAGTRHNIGFEIVNRLKGTQKLERSKHKAIFIPAEIEGHGVLLVKPLTYMNLSGQAVSPLAREYKIPPERILVIADDLDTPLGKLKLKQKGGPGGHNGHKSLIASLGTTEYPRLKIGIGKVDRTETVDHVLSKFTADEKAELESVIEAAIQTTKTLIVEGMDPALRVLEKFHAPK